MSFAAPIAQPDAPLARRNPVAKLAAGLALSFALLATLDPVAPAIALSSRNSSPSGITTSSASTWCVVNPYFKQWAPPEFSATLPPIEHTCWLEGSGA